MNARHKEKELATGHLERYLDILGLERRAPSLDFLNELLRAQLSRIPFENLSKLYYQKILDFRGIPEIGLYLDGIERFHFGGTCFSLNYHFYLLLASLGFQTILCGADMRDPDVHLVSMVTLENRVYLVDVGYAAPFTEAIPCDLTTDHLISRGRDRYIFRPRDASGGTRMELFRNGKMKHGYYVNPRPRHIREFRQNIENSYREDSTFMNTLLLTRSSQGRSIAIHNLNVIVSEGGGTEYITLNSKDELVKAIFRYFSIPGDLSKELVLEMKLSGDAWN